MKASIEQELIDCLLTGIPSRVIGQFLLRFVSGASLTKLHDTFTAAFAQLGSLLLSVLLPTLERLAFLMSHLLAQTRERTMMQQRLEAIGIAAPQILKISHSINQLHMQAIELQKQVRKRIKEREGI